MANSNIKEVHMKLIIERINEGRCVPFLGAAGNVECEKLGYKGLPLGTDIATELVKQISFTGRDPKDLAKVSLEFEFCTDRSFLIKSLKTILPDNECEASPLLKTIARIPFKLIITTNYDRLMERALEDEGREFRVVVQPTDGFDNTSGIQKMLNELIEYEGRIIYKIHGTFNGSTRFFIGQMDENELDSLIVTEDDYIQFLMVMDKQEQKIGIPRQITSKLSYSTLLFLGYSLEDWDFRTIYKGLIESLPKQQARRSFAFQKKPSKFWVEFWKSKGVEIYDVDLYDFADQLDKFWKKYGKITEKC